MRSVGLRRLEADDRADLLLLGLHPVDEELDEARASVHDLGSLLLLVLVELGGDEVLQSTPTLCDERRDDADRDEAHDDAGNDAQRDAVARQPEELDG